MSNYEVRVDGVEDLISNLRKINANIRGSVAKQAVAAGATLIEDQARINAPVLTGALRGSASTITRQIDGGAEAEIGFRDIVYARIQEFGGMAGRNHSVRITGKLYLSRAIDQQRNAAGDAMGVVIRSYLDK